MANDASVTIQATVLPDEIAKTFSASMTVTPEDANDKWYYKKTSVSNSSTDLIAGNYTDYTAVDDDTAPTAVATGDKVKFLFIKNVDTNSRSIFIVLDAGTASSSATDGITIGPSEALQLDCQTRQLPTFTLFRLHPPQRSSYVLCLTM